MKITLTTLVLSFFVLAVCYSDLRYQKIYNWLTIPFLVLGIVINTWLNGINGLYLSITGMLTGLALLFLPFLWGWIGGGDVKFLAAAGAFISPTFILFSTLYGLILCGLAALIHLTVKGKLKCFLSQLMITMVSKIKVIEISEKFPLGFFLGIGIFLNLLYTTYPF